MSFLKKIEAKYYTEKRIQDAVDEFYHVAKKKKPKDYKELLKEEDIGLMLDEQEREKVAQKAFHIYEGQLDFPEEQKKLYYPKHGWN